MPNIIENLYSLYMEFKPSLLDDLDNIYSQDVQFKDPLHEIRGVDNLRHYFAGMMQGLDECRFEFDHKIESPAQGECVLFWTMYYRHRKLAGGNPLVLTGNSHLRYAEKIYYHRDYFDAGAMLYEQIPLLGFAIGRIKKRMDVK
jgi:hypothetical protein